jgi:hypothetical protein
LAADEDRRLQSLTLFEWLCDRYPGRFQPGQLRTLQRRVRDWRAQHGSDVEAYFEQTAVPGREGALDFTDASDQHIAVPFVEAVTTRSFIRDWMTRAALQSVVRAFDSTYSRTAALGDILSERLYEHRSCADLPEAPYTILNATSLISVRAWRFTRHGLGDSRVGYADWNTGPPLSVGHAVAASAAFPPVFSPVRIDSRAYTFSGTTYRDAPVALRATPEPGRSASVCIMCAA